MRVKRSLKKTELIFKGLSSSKRLLILDVLDKPVPANGGASGRVCRQGRSSAASNSLHPRQRRGIQAVPNKTNLSLSEISEFLHLNLKTAASHCQRLESAGLISKKKKGRQVIHGLTYLGRGMLTIARRTRDLVERK